MGKPAERPQLHHDNPFAERVRKNPYDDTPRLIFADYLEESGDPLGEFIRVQVGLSQLPANDPGRAKLESRERELIEIHGEAWLEPLRKLGVEGVSIRCFKRGLIERIKISANNWLVHGNELCSCSPALHTLQLKDLDVSFDDFADAALPAQIRGLDLTNSKISNLNDLSKPWFHIPCIDQMRELDLRFTRTTDRELTGLCRRDLRQLQRLDLGANAISASGAMALAGCVSLQNLRALFISLNKIGSAGVRAIATSPNLTNLRELDLASNGIDVEGAAALASSANLASLERLNLRANRIGTAEFQTIEGYRQLRNLRHFDARNNHQ